MMKYQASDAIETILREFNGDNQDSVAVVLEALLNFDVQFQRDVLREMITQATEKLARM